MPESFLKIKHYINRLRYNKTRRILPEIDGGYGACGQDIFIAELLNYKKDGFFVDIGANDGVTINNSYYFEKELGWAGVAIEPIPTIFESLVKNRTCLTFNGCVTTKPGKAKFLELIGGPNMLSTLEFNYKGLTARRLRKNAMRNNTSINEIDVECATFSMITERFGIEKIDVLSLDIEGGELDILKSINFEKMPIKIITVENNYFDEAIKTYLESKGFLYLGTFKVDEIYLFGGNALKNAVSR